MKTIHNYTSSITPHIGKTNGRCVKYSITRFLIIYAFLMITQLKYTKNEKCVFFWFFFPSVTSPSLFHRPSTQYKTEIQISVKKRNGVMLPPVDQEFLHYYLFLKVGS
jgi:hypothetical protein